MEYQYAVSTKKLTYFDGSEYVSFGLECITEENGTYIVLASIDDISLNLEKVKGMAKRFTKYQLNPDHLLEAIDDSFGEEIEL